jgi:NADH:ubiquinone oxidoreductase subunit 4 (subunit M)
LCFGNVKLQYIGKYKDLTGVEVSCLFPLIILTIIFGIAPDIILTYTNQEVIDVLHAFGQGVTPV